MPSTSLRGSHYRYVMNGHVKGKEDGGRLLKAGIKRSLDQSELRDQPAKRPRVVGPKQHRLRHAQQLPLRIEPAPQDEDFTQSQLLRAISIALSDAGFDSVEPSALEAFRANTEEYLLDFLSDIKRSMEACRRTQPIPHDFTSSLASRRLTLFSLLPRRKQRMPVQILQPPIPPPPPDEPPLPSFDALLGPALTGDANRAVKKYIPSHFPPLPSKHTYQYTPVLTEREKDPRKIREQATRESLLAEKALRKLIAASKAGRRGSTHGFSERRHDAKQKREEQLWEETMAAFAPSDETEKVGTGELETDFGVDGAGDVRHQVDDPHRLLDEGLLVNYDRVHWMKGGPAAASRA